jgi:hypothetical protein
MSGKTRAQVWASPSCDSHVLNKPSPGDPADGFLLPDEAPRGHDPIGLDSDTRPRGWGMSVR